jgi:hypothetical protein
VIDAYRRFWAVASTVDSQSQPRRRTLLAAVAAEPLLSRLLSGLEAQRAAGDRQYGVVITHPIVVWIEADQNVHRGLLGREQVRTAGHHDRTAHDCRLSPHAGRCNNAARAGRSLASGRRPLP